MISKETENKIIELCNGGMCIRHIAKELNLSDSPVERVLKENGLKAVDGSKEKIAKERLDKAVELYSQGYTLTEIESMAGVKHSVVNKELDKRKIAKRNNRAENLEGKIIDLYKQGLGSYQIADRLGCSRTLVVKVADENGIERQSTHISNETKDKIEELYTQGNSIKKIAKEMKMSHHTVGHLLRDRGYNTARKSSHKLTAKEIDDKLGEAWMYVGGYTGYYGDIIIRCTRCGKEKKMKRGSISDLGECSCVKAERKAEKETEKILAFWDKLQKPRPLFKDFVVASCRNCGKPFVKEGQSRFCSDECRRSSSKAQRYRHDDRRLRRKNASECDNITLDALINRDGLNCWICGEPCDLEDSFWIDKTFYAGNRYPSVDHVIPLAKGGTHTWDNVRVAHRICNSIKGDSVSND